jgi:hypothetical protein
MQVFRSALPDMGAPGEVALKVMDVPSTPHDCTAVEVFSEVALLERLAGRPDACALYDYGLDGGLQPLPCHMRGSGLPQGA